MRTKTAALALSFLGLLSAALPLASCQNNSDVQMEALKAQYQFAVPDTATITKVIISDKVPSSVVLQRTPNGWVVGADSLPVRKDAIEVLLETLGQVTLRSFVAEQARSTVEQRMDINGRWVEVFAGEERIRHYVVGTETPDMLGTYYKMVGAELPFAVYIPGFNGYLTTRFFTEESLWRERTVFGYTPQQLKAVELYSPASPGASWTITRPLADLEGAGDEALATSDSWTLVGGEYEPLPFRDEQLLRSVVASIKTLKYEGAVVESDPIWQKKDSIFASVPAFQLTVHLRQGGLETVDAFYKKADNQLLAADGTPQKYDPDRFYARLPDGRMVLIQRYGWRNILLGAKEFN